MVYISSFNLVVIIRDLCICYILWQITIILIALEHYAVAPPPPPSLPLKFSLLQKSNKHVYVFGRNFRVWMDTHAFCKQTIFFFLKRENSENTRKDETMYFFLFL